jgi:hypothetical protein
MTNVAAATRQERNVHLEHVSDATHSFDAGKKKKLSLSSEDMEIVEALEAVKSDMDFLHNCFDHTTDAVLVDSLVYEIKAANLKFQYYLNLCKEKGIVHSGVKG